jgi:hypothetical protein
MKIRNGFVSNSSSSSFFCVLSKKDHDKIMSGLTEAQRKAIDKYVENGVIGEIEVVGYGYFHDRDDNSAYSGELYFNDYGATPCEISNDEWFDATAAYDKALRASNIKAFNMEFNM